jgi:hypothetical protein
MEESDYKITWMRSILRLEVMADPFLWPDEVVIFAFAARVKQDCISYENWCLKIGLNSKPHTEIEENEAALNLLKATAPKNVSIEEKH